MNVSSLRELGADLMAERQFLRALGVFAEAVKRVPEDHRARIMGARCYVELGERERAVLVLHTCAEGLLGRDYLLSSMAACKAALSINPHEKMVRETLLRIHARAVRAATGRATVPPTLPTELPGPELSEDLMALQGSELSDRAFEVLLSPDSGARPDPAARPPLPLFADLEPQAFMDLVLAMDLRTLPPQTTVAEAGKGSDALYVIVAGKAEVSRVLEGQPKTLAFLGGGSMFGEVSLLTGTLPAATVSTVVDSDLFEVRREHLNALSEKHETVAQALADFAQGRMARSLMATSPLFRSLPEADRPLLLERFHFRAFGPGERAVEEGALSEGLFLVLAGELVVQKRDPQGGQVTLGVLHEGDVAGEISLLTGQETTATVSASRRTATAFLDRAAFPEVMERFPQVKSFLEGLSSRRLKAIGEALHPPEIIDADELVLEGEPDVA